MMSEERHYPTSKLEFHSLIYAHYSSSSRGLLAESIIKDLADVVTDYQYSNYKRWYLQYPKSEKRYSKFDVKDLDHMFVYEVVVRFFKKRNFETYRESSAAALNWTAEELSEFERKLKEFIDAW